MQSVRDPKYYQHSSYINKNNYAFKRMEVEHMAGIIPVPKPNSSFNRYKQMLLQYNENAVEIYNDKSLHSKFLYLDEDDIDYSFFKEQYDFLLSLSEKERSLLNLYSDNHGYQVLALLTKHKDDDEDTLGSMIESYGSIIDALGWIFDYPSEPVNLSSAYSYDPPPIFTLDGYEEYEKAHLEWLERERERQTKEKEQAEKKRKRAAVLGIKFFEGMKAIFEKAPAVKKQIRLFRGIKVDRDPFKNGYIPDLFYGFVSTSYDPEKTIGFTQEIVQRRGEVRERRCCVFDILVQPGVKAVWLSPISKFHTTVKKGDYHTDPNDRGNTEREIILYCDETIQAKFSKPTLKTILYAGADNNSLRFGEIITYDTILGIKPKGVLTRSLGKRYLLTRNNTGTAGGKRFRKGRKTRKST